MNNPVLLGVVKPISALLLHLLMELIKYTIDEKSDVFYCTTFCFSRSYVV